MIEEVCCTRRIAASSDTVWRIARAFGAPWHPWIDSMSVDSGGAERIFTVSGDISRYRERLTYFSDSDRTFAYRHLEGIAECQSYDARLQVKHDGSDQALVSWRARIKAPKARAGEIADGTRAVFDAGLSELERLAADKPQDDAERALPAPVETTHVQLAGKPSLAFDSTNTRDGPLCLFLHGIGGGRGNWADQLRLAGSVTRSAALDLRGYGDSTLGDQTTTLNDHCTDILHVLESTGATRLILCGLSYGAWIATSFALRHPEILDGLILSGGCTGMSEADPQERDSFRQSRQAPLDAGQSPADFAPAVVNILAGPETSDATREQLQASMAAIPAATYRDALSCFTNPPERFDFSRLNFPVLLMTGAYDRLAPPAEIRGVAQRIYDTATEPDVRFEVIPGAGHVCNLDKPGIYNRLLLEFLHRVRA